MAKLYFKYGAMGSSKTANALMTKFNYEEKGRRVLLLKPSKDTRDGENIVSSRIGLKAECETINEDVDIEQYLIYKHTGANQKFCDFDVIIVDECQFLTEKQVMNLRAVASFWDIPVLCYGIRTDFQGKLFPGSQTLFAFADSISEIKSICACGNKAILNVRIDDSGNIVTSGPQVQIGANETYKSMCYFCYKQELKKERKL